MPFFVQSDRHCSQSRESRQHHCGVTPFMDWEGDKCDRYGLLDFFEFKCPQKRESPLTRNGTKRRHTHVTSLSVAVRRLLKSSVASAIAFATIIASLNPSVAGRSQGALWELPAIITVRRAIVDTSPIAARLRSNCAPGLTEKAARRIQSQRPIKRRFCIESWHGHLASSF